MSSQKTNLTEDPKKSIKGCKTRSIYKYQLCPDHRGLVEHCPVQRKAASSIRQAHTQIVSWISGEVPAGDSQYRIHSHINVSLSKNKKS